MQLSYLRALVATNVRSSVAQRAAFLAQAAFMMLNNLLYYATWWILFDRFEQIRGWRHQDVLALQGLAITAVGLSVACFGGTRHLARTIVEGGLDGLLTQPKNVLAQAIAARSIPSGWGDAATGILFLGLSGYATLEHLPATALAVVAAMTVATANAVLMHSFSFWLGDVNALARQGWEVVTSLSLYPPTLFEGWLKMALFTLLPAGLVTFLPVELLRNFSLGTAVAVVATSGAYAALTAAAFNRGLRRYASGNRILVRS